MNRQPRVLANRKYWKHVLGMNWKAGLYFWTLRLACRIALDTVSILFYKRTMNHRIYLAVINDETGLYDLFIQEPDGYAQRAFHRNMDRKSAERKASEFTETERQANILRRQEYN